MPQLRETFSGRFGTLMTMIGVAVGLGNVWRFPYMVGEFGGAAFVLFYVVLIAFVGVPALATEWTLGRATGRGTVGAFAAAGLPFGRVVGWFFFCVVAAATGYYSAVIGWVLYHAAGELARLVGTSLESGSILPPANGFDAGTWLGQAAATGIVLLACAGVMIRGVRKGIEAVSKTVTPALFLILILLIVRSVTLEGAGAGLQWYVLKIEPSSLRASVVLAALGQVVFSLALGGTFMVVYGSYLKTSEGLTTNALITALGDTGAGLLAGLAIFPAVFALGLEPGSGPGLIFETLPSVFAAVPGGAFFGAAFFLGLGGVAFLSAIAALEVLVAGMTDNTQLSRADAVRVMTGVVFVLSLIPTINLKIFGPWDLTFGSGMQTLGAFAAAVTVGWALKRSVALKELGSTWLYTWVRYVIPTTMVLVGGWWLSTEVLG